MQRRFVGIDLAKRTYVVRIETEEGKGQDLQGKTDKKGLGKLIAALRVDDRVAIEAGAFGFWLAKHIKSQTGCEVYVLNPGRLAIIYRSTVKTDLEDAGKLAWILRRLPPEELPVVAIPSAEDEDRRALSSELHSKKTIRTRLVNRLHSVFVRVGHTDMEQKDLKTSEVRKKHVERLSGRAAIEANRLLEEIDLVEKHIAEIESEIATALLDDEKAERLMTIPGVSTATAMAFIAHVGDGSRFANASQVSNFVGMTPRIYSSGETTRLGHISKRGCAAIRAIIVQSAWAAVHAKNNCFKEKYLEMVDRVGKKRAIVAVARRMLEVMWILVTRKEQFRDYDVCGLRRKLRELRKKSGIGKIVA